MNTNGKNIRILKIDTEFEFNDYPKRNSANRKTANDISKNET
jgi:hypothetical protein